MPHPDRLLAVKQIYWRWHARLAAMTKPKRHLPFWFKTALYRLTPGGFGYYRHLRGQRDPNYDFERDKHPARLKHHGRGGWEPEKKGRFRYRNYDSYEEYIAHQKSKFVEMLAIRGGSSNREVMEYRLKFFRRFANLPQELPRDGTILCLGARQGTEVEVLRDLGYPNAYGIDLHPGPDNPWVRPGDFMNLEEADNSVDMVYSNAVDHAFNLDRFMAEQARIIKPGGHALYDLVHVSDQRASAGFGAFEAVEWDDDNDMILLLLQYFKTIIRIETEENWKFVLLREPRKQPLPGRQTSEEVVSGQPPVR